MNGKFKDVLFVLILGSVSTVMLLGIQNYTSPIIKKFEELKRKSTILDAASVIYSKDNIEELFEKNIREVKGEEIVYYLSRENYYIFEFEGRGLWGPIKGVITLNQDLETLESLRILSQEETPGLGSRITEEAFLSTFVKKNMSPELKLVSRKR